MFTRMRHKLVRLILRPEILAISEAPEDAGETDETASDENPPHIFGHFNLIDEDGYEIRVGGFAQYPLRGVGGDGGDSDTNGPDDREHRGQTKTR